MSEREESYNERNLDNSTLQAPVLQILARSTDTSQLWTRDGQENFRRPQFVFALRLVPFRHVMECKVWPSSRQA